MKRAVQVFQNAGMRPIPAPTDFILKDRPAWTVESLLPSCGNMEITSRVVYEWLGEAWQRVKGTHM